MSCDRTWREPMGAWEEHGYKVTSLTQEHLQRY